MPLLVIALALFVTNPQSTDTTAKAQAVVTALQAKEFVSIEVQFTDRMRAALPAGQLERIWSAVAAQAGALKKCDAPIVAASGVMQVARVPCDFERARVDVQISFNPAGQIGGLAFRPAAAPYALPSYATPSAYGESDVTIGKGEWALPGTLTMPAGAGPFPAIVLVQGSGPNDRDETIGPNKPFEDLALGLASRGIAVIRYDKRTKVYGAKMASVGSMTVREEVVDDALLALALARTLPRIDPARTFVLGHSLGGMLVPRIAAADPTLAGAIVMAGAARSLDQAMLEQTKYVLGSDGTITPDDQARIDDAAKLVATVAALKPEDAASGTLISGAPASYWLDLRGYDPPVAAKAVKVRMLILQGERDYQVTMEEFGRWKAALSDRPDVTFHSYPVLNHLFLPGVGKSLPAEYNTASHVADEVIRDIADWVKR